jgi:hypothetical protein
MAYMIRLRHSKVVRVGFVLLGIIVVASACDDPYSPDRWLPGD